MEPNGSKPLRAGVSSDTRLLSATVMGDMVSEWSPLHEAAVHGRLLSLMHLISQGWPVNLVTTDRVSPLHEACLGGHPACVSVLLKHGAQVNGVTSDWHTPLFNACLSGNQKCVELLLQHGANPDSASDLASPIHEAAKRGFAHCIETLSTYGCNIDYSIHFLGTPLYLACSNQHMASIKTLLQAGADVNQGLELESPLHVAARVANKDMAIMLLDFGANMQAKDEEGKRPVELLPEGSPLNEVFQEYEGPPTLMQLCRLRIRKCFGYHPRPKIVSLVLPEELKRYLLHV